MTQQYLRNIVRSGSRPVRPAAARNRDQRALEEASPKGETAMHAMASFLEAPGRTSQVQKTHHLQGLDDGLEREPVKEPGASAPDPAVETGTARDHDGSHESKPDAANSSVSPRWIPIDRQEAPNQDSFAISRHAGEQQAQADPIPGRIHDVGRSVTRTPGRTTMSPLPGDERPPSESTASETVDGSERPHVDEAALFPIRRDAAAPGTASTDPERGPSPSRGEQRSLQSKPASLEVFFVTPGLRADKTPPAAGPSKGRSVDSIDRMAASRPAIESAARPEQSQPARTQEPSAFGAPLSRQLARQAGGSENDGAACAVLSPIRPRSGPPAQTSTGRPRELQAGEAAPSRRTDNEKRATDDGVRAPRGHEGGLRLSIQRLDVQFINSRPPEPPRQPPQPAAASRDSWENMDRHYLPHGSLNI